MRELVAKDALRVSPLDWASLGHEAWGHGLQAIRDCAAIGNEALLETTTRLSKLWAEIPTQWEAAFVAEPEGEEPVKVAPPKPRRRVQGTLA